MLAGRLKADMKDNDLIQKDAEDRAKWRKLSRKADSGTKPGKR